MKIENYKIYAHINKINGKIYIGQTKTSVESRWQNGKGYKPCLYFYRAIEKYGWDGFLHIVLFENLSSDMANIIESELIKKYNTTNILYGYNIRTGGDNSTLSDESKLKISKANKGKLSGEKNPIYGTHRSDETKEKIREKLIGRFCKEKNPWYGKHPSEETREKLRQANIGKKLSEEHKQKISESCKGKECSEETREKLSKKLKGRQFSEEHKKHISESRIGSNNPYAKKIIQRNKDNYEIIKVYGSMEEASKETGVRADCISNTCRGKQKTSGGFIWEYAKTD